MRTLTTATLMEHQHKEDALLVDTVVITVLGLRDDESF